MKKTGLKTSSGLKSTSRLLSKGSRLEGKSKALLRQKPINIKSKSQKETEMKLSEIYTEMDKRDDIVCRGCNRTLPVDHSHIIPRSWSSDLVAVRENITDHCTTCHDTWEHGTREEKTTLLDFEENMEYIRKTDYKYYQILNTKK